MTAAVITRRLRAVSVQSSNTTTDPRTPTSHTKKASLGEKVMGTTTSTSVTSQTVSQLLLPIATAPRTRTLRTTTGTSTGSRLGRRCGELTTRQSETTRRTRTTTSGTSKQNLCLLVSTGALSRGRLFILLYLCYNILKL